MQARVFAGSGNTTTIAAAATTTTTKTQPEGPRAGPRTQDSGVRGPGSEQDQQGEQTHHRMRNEDLGLVAIVLLLHFLSRDSLEADLHHGSSGVTVPSS